MTDRLTDAVLDEGERLLRELERYSYATHARGKWIVARGRWENWRATYAPALIAEVRRLRERVAELEGRRTGRGATISERVHAVAARRLRNLLRHQERYVSAWVAATGVHPIDAVLCHRTEMRGTTMVDTFWVERRETQTTNAPASRS